MLQHHEDAAKHYEEAAKHHAKAAHHVRNGNFGKAAEHAETAHAHHEKATDAIQQHTDKQSHHSRNAGDELHDKMDVDEATKVEERL